MSEYEDDLKKIDKLTYASLLNDMNDDDSVYEYLDDFGDRNIFKKLSKSDILKIEQIIKEISRKLEE